jgi:hypothetical protein
MEDGNESSSSFASQGSDNESYLRNENSSDDDEPIVLTRKGKDAEISPQRSPSSRMIKFVPKDDSNRKSENGEGDEVSVASSAASSRQSFQQKMASIRKTLSEMNKMAEEDAISRGSGRKTKSSRNMSSSLSPKNKKKKVKPKSMRSLQHSDNSTGDNGQSNGKVLKKKLKATKATTDEVTTKKKKPKSNSSLSKSSSDKKVKSGGKGKANDKKSISNPSGSPTLEKISADDEKKKKKKTTSMKKALSSLKILQIGR